jgi:hypothetical protein
MVTRVQLTGKQLARINSKPNVYRKAGAQLMGKEILGSEKHLQALRRNLQEWIAESGEVTLEMDLQPIIDQIDAAVK